MNKCRAFTRLLSENISSSFNSGGVDGVDDVDSVFVFCIGVFIYISNSLGFLIVNNLSNSSSGIEISDLEELFIDITPFAPVRQSTKATPIFTWQLFILFILLLLLLLLFILELKILVLLEAEIDV